MSVDKKEYIIKLQGREYILFAGLLAIAHADGLKETRTELLQVPSESNKNVAIVQATVVTSKGTFQALGDASPDNVNKMILPHIIRMAETRSLARALRIATNIGETSVEECDFEEAVQGQVPPAQKPQGKPAAAKKEPATKAQKTELWSLAKQCGWDQAKLADYVQYSVSEELATITAQGAARVIAELQDLQPSQEFERDRQKKGEARKG